MAEGTCRYEGIWSSTVLAKKTVWEVVTSHTFFFVQLGTFTLGICLCLQKVIALTQQRVHVIRQTNLLPTHEPSDNWPAIRVTQPAISSSKNSANRVAFINCIKWHKSTYDMQVLHLRTENVAPQMQLVQQTSFARNHNVIYSWRQKKLYLWAAKALKVCATPDSD